MKILKNYFYNLFYQIFTILVPIITIPYISRAIGPTGTGINAYTNSMISYFVLLANFGFTLYGSRMIAYKRDDIRKMSASFWEILISKMIMMSISLGIFGLFYLFQQNYRFFLLLQSIQIVAAGLDISWLFIGLEDFKRTVIRNFIVKIFSVMLIFLFVHQKSDLWIYISILSISTLLGNLTLWTYLKKHIIHINFRELQIKQHFFPASILFLPQLTTIAFVTFNRLILGNFSTMIQTGFFDNSDKIVRIFLSVLTALGTVLFPRIAYHFQKGEQDIANKYVSIAFQITSCISFPLVAGIIVLAKPFSDLFYGASFKGVSIVLSILSVELIFMGWSSIIGQQYMVAIKKTRGLTVSILVALIICVTTSILVVPFLGAVGAASISVFGECIIIIVQLFYVRNEINLKLLFDELWKYLLSSVVMFIVCFIVSIVLTISAIFKIIIVGLIGVVIYFILLKLLRAKIFNYLSLIRTR